MKALRIPRIIISTVLLAGCVGSPLHSTFRYSSIQGDISRNNRGLMMLNIGMTKEQVMNQMGEPERSEGYAWGSAWLYRTAMTSGVYGTADSDFTPVVFDENGQLVGWGRNFFTEHVRRYDIKIKHE
jgi:outer membrane protein assembly factor BamE (lipoprotein component of BamABCDE complex)